MRGQANIEGSVNEHNKSIIERIETGKLSAYMDGLNDFVYGLGTKFLGHFVHANPRVGEAEVDFYLRAPKSAKNISKIDIETTIIPKMYRVSAFRKWEEGTLRKHKNSAWLVFYEDERRLKTGFAKYKDDKEVEGRQVFEMFLPSQKLIDFERAFDGAYENSADIRHVEDRESALAKVVIESLFEGEIVEYEKTPDGKIEVCPVEKQPETKSGEELFGFEHSTDSK